MEAFVSLKPVGCHDENADHRGEAGGKHCAEDSHLQGEHEYVVQDDVGKTSADSGSHGELRVAVVPDEAEQDIIEDEGRRKQQQDLQVRIRHLKDSSVCSQEGSKIFGQQKTDQKEQDGKDDGQIAGVGKHHIRFLVLSLAFADGKACGAAHAQHQPGSVDKVVGGDGKIQRSQPAGPKTLGHKESVCQDIAGHCQHSEDAKQRVLCKFR